MVTREADPFFHVYDRRDIAYGMEPSATLEAYVRQCRCSDGVALDLGAGAGRDSLFLARNGYDVTAVDMSQRGLERVQQRAEKADVSDRISTVVSDVRDFILTPKKYDLIVATTMLDHIPAGDSDRLFEAMALSLTARGAMYVEVHTTEDPGSDVWPGNDHDLPVSETAGSVINYFRPNQLASMAISAASPLRILQYEERMEWDQTHGSPHAHGKAIMLAVGEKYHPLWEGVTRPFPIPRA